MQIHIGYPTASAHELLPDPFEPHADDFRVSGSISPENLLAAAALETSQALDEAVAAPLEVAEAATLGRFPEAAAEPSAECLEAAAGQKTCQKPRRSCLCIRSLCVQCAGPLRKHSRAGTSALSGYVM